MDYPEADTDAVLVVSNRGPLSFSVDEQGNLQPVRAGGGLVASLAPALQNSGASWASVAATEGDRVAARDGAREASGFCVRQIEIDPELYRRYYDVISNGNLWFLHHHLFSDVAEPVIDDDWWNSWHAYVRVNEAFGQCIAEMAPEGSTVLAQDYHLSLLGKWLRDHRPDLRTVHFHHTPFVDPENAHYFPAGALKQLLEGLDGYGACGFHSQRWADSFLATSKAILGRSPTTFVSAATPDVEDITKVAESLASQAARQRFADMHAAGRKVIVRVDRIELSKNIVRGFEAYEQLLRDNPAWRERVVFAAFTYPSRVGLPEYVAYKAEIEDTVERVNQRWQTDNWVPIEIRTHDDFPTSVAAYLEYDVLLVNPVRDGLNLVAKEGPLLNRQNGVVVLSHEAGAWNGLQNGALGVDPFDVTATAEALKAALEMPDDERKVRADDMRRVSAARTSKDWFDDQLRAAK